MKHKILLSDDGPFIMRAVDLGGKAPAEIQLMPLGKWDGYIHPVTHQATSFEVTPDHVRAAVAHHQERKTRNPERDLVIDYEHQTLTGGEAPAAGWIGELKDGGADGLIGSAVRWTPKGKGFIENGEYRYISPVFSFSHVDKVSGRSVAMAVFNAGLTNEPFFDELKPLVSKDKSLIYLYAKEASMDPITTFLVTFLALAATAKPEEIVAKANQFIEQLKGFGIAAKDSAALTAAMIVEQLGVQKTQMETLKANYALVAKALNAPENATVEQLKALIAKGTDTSLFVSKADHDALLLKMQTKEVDELISAAIAKGKITPATKESMEGWAKKDLEGFKAFLAKVADYSAVPMQQIKVADQAAGSFQDGQPSVQAIQDFAAKQKISFKEAAIQLTTKKD